MEPEELAGALKRLADWAQEHAPDPEPAVRRRLREHLGDDPRDMPIVARALAQWDRPNFQVAIDAWTEGRDVDVIGLPEMQGYRAGLAELARGSPWLAQLEVSALEHVTVPLGEHESITCVRSGFWLVRDAEGPIVAMLKSSDRGMGESLELEVLAPERERAERVLAELWKLMSERNVYRGRVLELRSRHFHEDEGAPLTVRTLPPVGRDRIVLGDGVLERIERHAFGIADHAERLRASGRHLRRGLLLHGAPGTGPAMVVLEDVDLVAMDRDFEPTNAVLFELLNGMDGLDEDHDVLFVLTTNRADLLEPALAARPGRVDQAVELPLPDAEGRRRLLELYGEGLELTLSGDESLIGALEGVSPAFIRELLRRAALLSAEDSEGALRVTAEHLERALAELRQGAGELTNTLLGARPQPGETR